MTGGCKKSIYVGDNILLGEIDLLIEDTKTLIEIKEWKSWKHAIGQIEVYRTYYPDYTPMIYFFGHRLKRDVFSVMKEICQSKGIKIAWKYSHINKFYAD